MIYQGLHSHYGWTGLLVATALFGHLLYFTAASLSYYVYFVLGRDRFLPAYREDRKKIRGAILWSVYGLVGNAVLVLPVQLLIVHGYFPLYHAIGEHGVAYLIISCVSALVFAETCIYWIHRALHFGFLYRLLHVHHHRFREPTPYAAFAFHPLDSFAQSLPYHVYALIVPMYDWAYLALFAFSMLWSLMIHDQVRWVPFRFINHTGCHTAHHWYYHYNYGNYFTFWDRLCGTYCESERLPDRFGASKQPLLGRPLAQSPEPTPLPGE
ncbi:sterol desaturase family protein [Bradyrhizobium diazoefficiens]|uniref:sterol desaturase family protein n=1 Tax=Bradyrhizobium diazoefficiens TaxID=1355477 RepID=UPI0035950324